MTYKSPSFNILFLGAGYGTRLARDIQADPTRSYHHLSGIAKALLPLSGKPLINYWIDEFRKVSKKPSFLCEDHNLYENMYVICNEFNHQQFLQWAQEYAFPLDHIYNDGSKDNESRLGAVRDMELAVSHFGLHERPLLVIAGDTLFLNDFELENFLEIATCASSSELNMNSQRSILTCYTVRKDEETLKTGILVLDRDQPVSVGSVSDLPICTGFLEKPHPNETTSRVACPCFYFLAPQDLNRISEFLEARRKQGAKLTDIDATGKFIGWLICEAKPTTKLLAYPISGRLDIGGLASLIEAETYLKSA